MRTPDDRTEKVQLWISLGQQPGLGGWLNVWLVSRSRKPKPAKSAAPKKLPQGACTA
ncbi:MAG TPA: hypothetical protein VGM16_07860 [Gammaproteobacteria bacterium]|jgi:hypothetical protein